MSYLICVPILSEAASAMRTAAKQAQRQAPPRAFVILGLDPGIHAGRLKPAATAME